MIKLNSIYTACLFAALSTSSYAAATVSPVHNPESSIIVNSTVKNLSATVVGDKIAYKKAFDVVVTNISNKPIDLSSGCFKAIMPDKTERFVDTIEDVLSDGKLKNDTAIKGFAVFSSHDESIYKAVAVKFSPTCK